MATLLEGGDLARCRELAVRLEGAGYHLRLTRDLDVARQYLRDRYGENPNAGFGLLASSRDRDLARLGIANDYQPTKLVRFGPWYGDGEERCASPRVRVPGIPTDSVRIACGQHRARVQMADAHLRAGDTAVRRSVR